MQRPWTAYQLPLSVARDTVQLETAVTTISQEYLLEFTSEYGISEALHPKLPGLEDRIVDFPEGKRGQGWMSFSKRLGKNTPQCYTKPLDSLKNWNNRFFWVDERVFPTIVDWRMSTPKDGMPAENTYSPKAVIILNTHRTPIQKQPEALLCLVGLSRIYYLGDEVYPTFLHDDDRGENWKPSPCRAAHEVPLLTVTANRVIEIEDPATATDSSGVPSTIERSPLDFAHENPSQQSTRPEDQKATVPEVPPPENVTTTRVAPEAGQAERVAAKSPSWSKNVAREATMRSSKGAVAARDPDSENTSFASMVGSPESIYWPEWGITNDIMLDAPEACKHLVPHQDIFRSCATCTMTFFQCK
nr:hypothetical protein [Tanacetum cinerariifolium]